MNLIVDETVEERKDGSTNNIGILVIRGNSIVMLESLDRVSNSYFSRKYLYFLSVYYVSFLVCVSLLVVKNEILIT